MKKWFPFLYQTGCDGKDYLFYKKFHYGISEDGKRYIYFFLSTMRYVIEDDFIAIVKAKAEAEDRNNDMQREIRGLNVQLAKKDDSIRNIGETLNDVKLENKHIREDYSHSEIQSTKSELKVEDLERFIQALKEQHRLERMETKFFVDRLNEDRDKEVADLKEIINFDRERFEFERRGLENRLDERVEKLAKNIEMIDRDFVDVAKAMRVYRQGQDKPSRGFRIRIDENVEKSSDIQK